MQQDDAKAVSWFSKAAEQGYANAQMILGLMYTKGKGVAQDYTQAYFWFSLAANAGIEDASKILDSVSRHMMPAAIAKEKARASRWLATHGGNSEDSFPAPGPSR